MADMSHFKFLTKRQVIDFQLEQENHVVVVNVDQEPDGIYFRFSSSDIPSYHHPAMIDQFRVLSTGFFTAQFGPTSKWTNETKKVFSHLGKSFEERLDAAIVEARTAGPIGRVVNTTFKYYNVLLPLEN